MNKIYKVIWSKVKHQYVVVSELVHSNGKQSRTSRNSIRSRIAALVVCGAIAAFGFYGSPVAYAGANEGATASESQYVAIGQANKNEQGVKKEQIGGDWWNPKYQYYKMIDGHKYIYTETEAGNFWVRDGYTIKIAHDQRFPGTDQGIDTVVETYKGEGADTEGILQSYQNVESDMGVNTLNGKKLQTTSTDMYVGAVNTPTTEITSSGNRFYIYREGHWENVGQTNFNGNFNYKDVKYDESTGLYTFHGEIVPTENLYCINGNVGVFTTTQNGTEIYKGDVYGHNNEILVTGVDEDGNYVSYWGSENVDPNAPIGNMPTSTLQYKFDVVNDNIEAVAEDNIKEIQVAKAEETDGTKGGTIGLQTNGDYYDTGEKDENGNPIYAPMGGANVPGAITITSEGGTGGDDVRIKFANEKGSFTVDAGSKVEATKLENNKVSELSINGETYAIGGGETYTAGNGIAIDEKDKNKISVKLKDGENNLTVDDSGLGLSRNLDVDSVTTGNTKVDASGLTIGQTTYVSSDGLNAGNQQIKNVANGTADTDAVNVSQLKTYVGENATYTADKGIAIDEENNVSVNAGDGLEFTSENADAQVKVKQGTGITVSDEGVSVKLKDGETNLTVDDSGLGLSRNLDVDSVTTGNTKVDASGLTIGQTTYVSSDGLNAGNQQIKNVANGTADTDAVNLGQLIGKTGDLQYKQNNTDNHYVNNDEDLTVSIGKLDNQVFTNTTNITELQGSTIDSGNVDENGYINLTHTNADNTTTTIASIDGLKDYALKDGQFITKAKDENGKFTGATELTIADRYDPTKTEKVTIDGLVTYNTTQKLDETTGETIVTGIDYDNIRLAGENGTRITNLVDGWVDEKSTDAVNGSQLWETQQQIKDVETTANKHTIVSTPEDSNLTVTNIAKNDEAANYQVALKDDITLKGDDSSIELNGTKGTIQVNQETAEGTDFTNINGNVVSIGHTNSEGTQNAIVIDGGEGTITGLSNTTWDGTTDDESRAATEGQLKSVWDKANTAASSHTEVTVNGGTPAGNAPDYSDGNLQLSQKVDEETGKTTYDVKLNDNITLGDKESSSINLDGNNGSIALTNSKGETAVTINKDGIVVNNSRGNKGNGADVVSYDYDGDHGYMGSKVGINSLNEIGYNTQDVSYSYTKGKTTIGNVNITRVNDPTNAANADKEILSTAGNNLVIRASGSVETKDDVIAKGMVQAGDVTVNAGNGGTINGLTNKTWNADNYVSGQAATEDQLQQATSTLTTNERHIATNGGDNPEAPNNKYTVQADGKVSLTEVNGDGTPTKNTVVLDNVATKTQQDINTDKLTHIEHYAVDDEGNTEGKDYTQVEGTKLYNDGSISSTVEDGLGMSSDTLTFDESGLTVSKETMGNGSGSTNISGDTIKTVDEYGSETIIDGGSVTTEDLTVNTEDGNKLTFDSTGLNVNSGDTGLSVNKDGISLSVDNGAGKNSSVKVTQDGTEFSYSENGIADATTTTIKGSTITTDTVTGLNNTTWDDELAKQVANSEELQGTAATQGQLQQAVSEVAEVANAGWTASDGTNSISIKPNETLNFVGDENLTVSADGTDKKLKVSLNDNITLGDKESTSITLYTDPTSETTVVGTDGNTTNVTGYVPESYKSGTGADFVKNNGGFALFTTDTQGHGIFGVTTKGTAHGKDFVTYTKDIYGNDTQYSLNDVGNIVTQISHAIFDKGEGSTGMEYTLIADFEDGADKDKPFQPEEGERTIGLAVREDGAVIVGAVVNDKGNIDESGIRLNDGGATITGLENTTWTPPAPVATFANEGTETSRAATEAQLNDLYSTVVGYNVDTNGVNYGTVTLGGGRTSYDQDTHEGGTVLNNVAYASGTDGSEAVNVDYLKDTINKAVEAGGSISNSDKHLVANTAEGSNGVYKPNAEGNVNLIVSDEKGNSSTVTIGDVASKTELDSLKTNVGDLNYDKVTGDKLVNGDSVTTAIGKLDNKIDNISGTATNADNNTVTGGTIKDDGTISLTQKDGDTVALDGKLTDSGVVQDGTKFDGETGTLTITSQDKYNKGTSSVTVSGIASKDDIGTVKDTIGATSKEDLKDAYKDADKDGNATTEYITDSETMVDADVALDHAVQDVANTSYANDMILSNRIDNVESRLGDVEERIDKVGAMAAAIANLRTMGYDPEAPTEVAVGVGQYKSETGIALGIFHYPNQDFMLSASISTSGDEVMGGIGATWRIGRKSAEEKAKDEEERILAKAEEIKQAAKRAEVKEQAERHAKLLAEREAKGEPIVPVEESAEQAQA